MLEKQCSEAGLDTTYFTRSSDKTTAVYVASLEGNGEMFCAISDMIKIEMDDVKDAMKAIKKAKYLLLDCNPSADVLKAAIEAAQSAKIPSSINISHSFCILSV